MDSGRSLKNTIVMNDENDNSEDLSSSRIELDVRSEDNNEEGFHSSRTNED